MNLPRTDCCIAGRNSRVAASDERKQILNVDANLNAIEIETASESIVRRQEEGELSTRATRYGLDQRTVGRIVHHHHHCAVHGRVARRRQQRRRRDICVANAASQQQNVARQANTNCYEEKQRNK